MPASRTGVNDIRELIDGVRYRPTSARFKIYIIDEVHMLSTAAFNALLKTLEEPPEHVKFIFATTEIRKIPVTVLSRCQRFDLRRVDQETLQRHFTKIAEQEDAECEPSALALIARAADGSVRDGLSLLDQAIAHGAGKVSEAQVRDMLGLADRARIFDLFDAVMKGDIETALNHMTEQYAVGADPVVILQDMLELTHWLTRLKLAPNLASGPTVSEIERVRGSAMAQGLSMACLTRTWQMLLKGLGEVRSAPSPVQAAEMVLIRLAFVADRPSPVDVLDNLRSSSASPAKGNRAPKSFTSAPTTALRALPSETSSRLAVARQSIMPDPAEPLACFADIVQLFADKHEMILSAALSSSVHLVRFEPGHLEIRTEKNAPADLATRVSRFLGEWTGRPWLVSLSQDLGQPTLYETKIEQETQRRQDAAADPLVQAVLAAFPGATIEAVRDITEEAIPSTDIENDTGESPNGDDE